MPHHHLVRVYYEDTDAGGVVYYANYLKYAERARTELLRKHGVEQRALAASDDVLFVVKDVHLTLHKPAFLDDELTIATTPTVVRGASIHMEQKIFRGAELLADFSVMIVCVNAVLKPKRIPDSIKNIFSK